MPVFEYQCGECNERFEKLMFSTTATVNCPGCSSTDVKKLPSTFGMAGVEKQTTNSAACSSCSSGSCASCGH